MLIFCLTVPTLEKVDYYGLEGNCGPPSSSSLPILPSELFYPRALSRLRTSVPCNSVSCIQSQSLAGRSRLFYTFQICRSIPLFHVLARALRFWHTPLIKFRLLLSYRLPLQTARFLIHEKLNIVGVFL